VVARTLVMLQRHLRLLMLGKFVGERRINPRGTIPDDVKDILTSELVGTLVGQAYRMPTYTGQAAKFSWDELIWMSCRILASDCAMKGIIISPALGATSPIPGDDPAANLRLLVAQLCSGMK
jgi:hypothetical protein